MDEPRKFKFVEGHECVIEVFQERIDGDVRSGLWCSYVPALRIVSQGSTPEEAFESAKEHVLMFAKLFAESSEMRRVADAEWKVLNGKLHRLSSPVRD